MTDAATRHQVTIVPANDASWEDLQAMFDRICAAAGFAQVRWPTLRRLVMHIDF